MPVDALPSTYQETLDFLFAQLPMYHRVGAAAFKKDLTNTLALCAHLDQPQHRFLSVHVGGTNGKGSVSHFLAAACQAAGLKTGMYISPHYKDFRERIRINGEYIPRERVTEFVRQHGALAETIHPSFFEWCVAMAFDYFAQEKVDIAIVEVGLGGRLDSTNVITPLLSVITNISFDHTDMLGHTLPLIAGEKAGIIKPGVPVVIGETHPETAPVFREKAAEMGASIVFADQSLEAKPIKEGLWNIYRAGHIWLESLKTTAEGPYQPKNMATALEALAVLDRQPAFRELLKQKGKTSLFPEAVFEGFDRLRQLTRFQGRWQVIGTRPAVLCDSAHNDAGLEAAFGQINQMKFTRLHIVTGFVNDKDLNKALRHFPVSARYYFAKANIPRGLDAKELKREARAWGLEGRAYFSVKNALRAARRHADPDDLIVVIGSIFVVAEVL